MNYLANLKDDKKVLSRFLSKVQISDGCWEWLATQNRNGYGQFSARGLCCYAHRVSYMLYKEDIPIGYEVCHSCDNPKCVNPDHLFLGTHLDNIRDRDSKNRQAKGERSGAYTHPEKVPRGDKHGMRKHPELRHYGDKNGSRKHPERMLRGEDNPRSKLNETNIHEIFKYKQQGYTIKQLACIFNVGHTTIFNVLSHQTWKHVEVK